LQGAFIPTMIVAMNWNTPTFEELRMDSEIGSYQEDRQEEREWPPTAKTEAAASEGE
jgi:hypothetical protein